MTDGTVTVIFTAGETNVAGDPIQKTLKVNGHEGSFDAIGIAAVRLAKDGKIETIAAGGLKKFTVGSTDIELPHRADVALWQDATGVWHGALQDYEGEMPESLAAFCKNWTRLRVPKPLQ